MVSFFFGRFYPPTKLHVTHHCHGQVKKTFQNFLFSTLTHCHGDISSFLVLVLQALLRSTRELEFVPNSMKSYQINLDLLKRNPDFLPHPRDPPPPKDRTESWQSQPCPRDIISLPVPPIGTEDEEVPDDCSPS